MFTFPNGTNHILQYSFIICCYLSLQTLTCFCLISTYSFNPMSTYSFYHISTYSFYLISTYSFYHISTHSFNL